MAARKSSQDPDNVFTLSDGLRVKIKPVDIIFVQSVIRSVKEPKKPTYTQYVGFNKRPVEEEIKDELTAKQLEEDFPGTIAKWEEYEAAVDDAGSERTDKSLRAIFLSGTEVPNDDEWASKSWLNRMEFLGLDIPQEREHAWVVYLLTNYNGTEILQLSQKIMKLTGVPEEMLAAAEDTFQSAIQDDSGSE